jgi:hypothetical protein
MGKNKEIKIMRKNRTIKDTLWAILIIIVAGVLLGSLSGCFTDEYVLPPNAKNVHELGGNWGQFDMEVNGKKHTFIYFHPATKNEVKAITVVD